MLIFGLPMTPEGFFKFLTLIGSTGAPYSSAQAKAQSGNPGSTSYTLTHQNGSELSTSFAGYANDMQIGDFNGDGIVADAAFSLAKVTTLQTSNITVVTVQGGSLTTTVYPMAVGSNPVSITSADVTGDSRPDLIVANRGVLSGGVYSGTGLTVLPANPSGGFSGAVSYTTSTPRISVGTGDFNGDGKPDLALADGLTANVYIRLNDGSGGYPSETSIPAPEIVNALAVLDYNVDVDGHDDILTTGGILLGNGSGSFPTALPFPDGFLCRVVMHDDLNGDGKPDIILGSSANLGEVILGTGGNSLSTPTYHTLADSPEGVATNDFDADGRREALFTNGGTDATLWPGGSHGAFRWVRALPVSTSLPNFQAAAGAAVADFTGDGIPDLVVPRGGSEFGGVLSGNATVLLAGLGSGNFAAPASIPNLPGSTIVTGNWNGDSFPDLALAGRGQSSPAVFIALGQGGGVFGAFTKVALPGDTTNAEFSTIYATNLDGDGDLDLVVANFNDGKVYPLLNNGGVFALQTGVTIGDETESVALGDFNGDGKVDLAASFQGSFVPFPNPPNGGAKVALGNGDGTFQTPVSLRGGARCEGIASADFNRDLKLDLALCADNGSDWDVEIYLGNGDGTFGSPAVISELDSEITSVSSGDLANANGITAADGDGDGKADLAVVFANDVYALRGLGDGTFKYVLRAPVGGGPVLAADLNLDGRTDLVGPSGEGYVCVYINDLGYDGTRQPALSVNHVANTSNVKVSWPDGYPDYSLKSTTELGQPFTPVPQSPVTDQPGSLKITVDANSVPTNYFRLED